MFMFFLGPLSFFLFVVFLLWWAAYHNPAGISVLFNITLVILLMAVVIVISAQHP